MEKLKLTEVMEAEPNAIEDPVKKLQFGFQLQIMKVQSGNNEKIRFARMSAPDVIVQRKQRVFLK